MITAVPPVTDHGFARWLAWKAGHRLMELRTEFADADAGDLRAAGDQCSHNLIMEELGRWRPSDAVLSEEGEDSPARLASDRVWIVDPLDGTREYGETGRSDWAVHICLWCGGRLVAGAVGLPARHRVLATDAPPAYPPLRQSGGPLRIAVSRTRPPSFLPALAEVLGGGPGGMELLPVGSVGAKVTAVLDGEADAYVHVGTLHEWDAAAPVAVARAAGLHASRFDGQALACNQPDPVLDDLVVCRKDLSRRLLPLLGEVSTMSF